MPHTITPLQAADLSMNNRAALSVFAQCGCYVCLWTYASSEVTKFIDILDTDAAHGTAVCLHCSVDAVLPGITDQAILRQCHEYWFCNDADPAAQG